MSGFYDDPKQDDPAVQRRQLLKERLARATRHDPETCTCRGSMVDVGPLAGILGPSPQSFDSVLSGLVRSYRQLDADEEQRQRDGYHANRERDARLRLLTELMVWLRPTVEREKAGWDAADAIDATVKDEEAWARLREAGLNEGELAQRSGTG